MFQLFIIPSSFIAMFRFMLHVPLHQIAYTFTNTPTNHNLCLLSCPMGWRFFNKVTYRMFDNMLTTDT